MYENPSVPSHKFVAYQQGDKRPVPRRAQDWSALIQARPTSRVGAYRLARRERPRSTTASRSYKGTEQALSIIEKGAATK